MPVRRSRGLARVAFPILLVLMPLVAVEAQDVLPGTAPLTMEEPLHEVMVRGISRHAELALHAAVQSGIESSSVPLQPTEVSSRRRQLHEITGVVDPRVTVSAHPFLTAYGSATAEDAKAEGVQIHAVTWRVMEGVNGEGLLLSPIGKPRAAVIAIPDASQTPEEYCGLQDGSLQTDSFPVQLARAGCLVVVPALIDRQDTHSGHPDIRSTNLPHREFIYRMAFELGRHIIGYELQRILAVVDGLEARAEGDELPIGICGYGDGGMLALFAAALDTRIHTCMVSGYFDQRSDVWKEPIDRNIWQRLPQFTDSALCQLIAPRRLIIDTRPAPEWTGPVSNREGRGDYAAPGRIEPEVSSGAEAEIEAVGKLYEHMQADDQFFSVSDDAAAAGVRFLQNLGPGDVVQDDVTIHVGSLGEPGSRQQRLFSELVRFTQMVLHRSDKVRAKRWQEADRSSVHAWQNSTAPLRELIHEQMIGRLPDPTTRLNPRSRKVIDTPTHAGYEVVLDVYPDTTDAAAEVIAGGILLIPKNLAAGERRPVIVCQHGLEGTPMDTITEDESQRAWSAYKAFSTQLVRIGYIVYAPQNPYKGYHDFRVIQRKSNPLGRSLFSYIIEQHRQTLRWLRSIPQVDPSHIGFYGLSYGGKTAVRVPPLLYREDGTPAYCLSICSADFNEWIRKNVSSEDRYSYVFTPEYEMFEWNMGHVAGYAELASLMAPRPFMVERGHRDGVAPDEWVAWEYAKVRRHYVTLGVADRTEIEWFPGPHTINGDGTFKFLQRHLPLNHLHESSPSGTPVR